jgi:hypothetical protein
MPPQPRHTGLDDSHIVSLFTHRPYVRPDYAEPIRERLNGKPRHVVIEPSWFAEVRQDWRSMLSEIRAEPESHALAAALGFFTALALIVLPFWLGAWG